MAPRLHHAENDVHQPPHDIDHGPVAVLWPLLGELLLVVGVHEGVPGVAVPVRRHVLDGEHVEGVVQASLAEAVPVVAYPFTRAEAYRTNPGVFRHLVCGAEAADVAYVGDDGRRRDGGDAGHGEEVGVG